MIQNIAYNLETYLQLAPWIIKFYSDVQESRQSILEYKICSLNGFQI